MATIAIAIVVLFVNNALGAHRNELACWWQMLLLRIVKGSYSSYLVLIILLLVGYETLFWLY